MSRGVRQTIMPLSGSEHQLQIHVSQIQVDGQINVTNSSDDVVCNNTNLNNLLEPITVNSDVNFDVTATGDGGFTQWDTWDASPNANNLLEYSSRMEMTPAGNDIESEAGAHTHAPSRRLPGYYSITLVDHSQSNSATSFIDCPLCVCSSPTSYSSVADVEEIGTDSERFGATTGTSSYCRKTNVGYDERLSSFIYETPVQPVLCTENEDDLILLSEKTAITVTSTDSNNTDFVSSKITKMAAKVEKYQTQDSRKFEENKYDSVNTEATLESGDLYELNEIEGPGFGDDSNENETNGIANKKTEVQNDDEFWSQ